MYTVQRSQVSAVSRHWFEWTQRSSLGSLQGRLVC